MDGDGADARSGAPSSVDYTMTALESFCVRLFDVSVKASDASTSTNQAAERPGLRLINEFFAFGITIAINHAVELLDQAQARSFADDLYKVGCQSLENGHLLAGGHESAPKSWNDWLHARTLQFDDALVRSDMPSDFMVPTAFSTGYFEGKREFEVKTAVTVAVIMFMNSLSIPAVIESWVAERARA